MLSWGGRAAVSPRHLAKATLMPNIVLSARDRKCLRRGVSRDEHAILYKGLRALLS